MSNSSTNIFGKEQVGDGNLSLVETLKRGDLVGHEYEVHKLLARGGFGEVYLARERSSGSACALKTIRTDLLADTASREAFKKEAMLWVNLEEHASILIARIVREFSRRLFVGMDYIPPDARGRVSLAAHIASMRGPQNADNSLKWAIQFCYGMEHALQRGIRCHRDIKPTNILITPDGMLKIADFGLALAIETAWAERTGSMVTEKEGGSFGLSLFLDEGKRICGTPGYIAPELFLGREADVRSDVYSFGLVLWQMVKGSPHPPFHVPYDRASNINDYLRRVFEQQMEEPVPYAGGPMQSAIERCLLPEPSERYANFEELRKDLEPVFRQVTGHDVERPRDRRTTAGFWSNKGVSLDELGRHEEAIACYEKALEIDPRSTTVWNNKGTALCDLGRHEEGMACYERALEIDPRYAAAWSNKGQALNALERPDEALPYCTMALEIEPKNSFAWDNKGRVLYALTRYDEALASFKEALQIDPRLARAWEGQAIVLAALGRHEESGASLAKAEKIDPQCQDDWKRRLGACGHHEMALGTYQSRAVACNRQGAAWAAAGRHEEALACFTEALEIDPRYGRACYNRGRILISLGRYGEALTCYTQTLEIDPLFPEAWSSRGHALGLLGRHEEAVDCLTKAVELAPQEDDFWNNKGIVLEAMGRLDEAVGCFTKALEIDPEPAIVWNNTGRALLSLGRLFEAHTCLARALEIDPNHLPAWNDKGKVLLLMGELVDGVACFDRALEIDPQFVEAWNNKGGVLRELGRLEEAIVCYKKALEIDPRSATVWNNKGIALGKLGRLEEAADCYEKALEIDPHFTAD